jgi:hypothetical protein
MVFTNSYNRPASREAVRWFCMDAASREMLTGLRNGLLRLHKSLLDSERASYERDVARITSTGQYLGLVMNDPWFAYLHGLSKFIVQVDEILAQKRPEPATDEDAANLLQSARALVAPAENAGGFQGKYFEAMQRDPSVVLAHRDMIRILGELPQDSTAPADSEPRP